MKTALNVLLSLVCAALLLGFLAGCNVGSGAPPAGLIALEITPANVSIALGTTKQLTATGIFSDNTRQDFTASVTWSSADASVATISNTAGSNGLASSVAAGSTLIRAAWGTISGKTALTVTSATLDSIEVTPANPSIALGTTVQLTATGVFSDSTRQDLTSSVTWTSSDASVSTVSNTSGSNGLALSVAPGSVLITAVSGTVSGNTTLTVTSAALVSIEVTPTNPSIALGTTKQLTATGIFSDSTRQDLTSSVTWSSSDAAVSVSNTSGSNGLATSSATGSATVTATSGAVSGSTTLTVTSATLVSIGVTPVNSNIANGRSQQLTATGIFSDNTIQDLTSQATWTSSNAAVATVSNSAGSNGLASSVGPGPTTITATLFGQSGNTTLTVTSATLQAIDITPAIPNIALGSSQQFTATGTFSDNTTEDLTADVVWSSSDTAVATVSNTAGSHGLATSVGAGLTTISAVLSGVTGTTDLTVDSAVLVSIDVAPTNPSGPMGLTQQFTASGNFSDGSVQDLTSLVTWSSSDTGVAFISNASGSLGLATPVAPGSTIITASFKGSSGTTILTISPATLISIAITPTTPRIANGTVLQFTATGTYSDGTSQDITALVAWNSLNRAVATISNAEGTKGLATSVGAGVTTITAALGATNAAPVTLTVTAATLTAITISPGNTTIFLGASQQFTATGTFSDSSTQDLTNQVIWLSSNKTIASVSNASGSNGLVTPLRSGSTNISATITVAGVTQTGTITLTISAAALTGITITPANPSVAVGKTVQFTATGTFTGGLQQDLTASVNLTWTSSDTTVATVLNAPKKNKGLAKGVSAGAVTIKAAMRKGVGGGISGATSLTVL